MKTTIDIPDALAADAKQLAHAEGMTLRELVIEGLREELKRRQVQSSRSFTFHTVGGAGMRSDYVGRPVTELAYDLPS